MKREEIKRKVKELRALNKTFSEINQIIGFKIPKSTLSYWTRDVLMSAEYKEKLKFSNKHKLIFARQEAVKVKVKQRKKYLLSIQKQNIHLLHRIDDSILKIMLSILYLGEGAKYRKGSTLGLASTSTGIIKFYLSLLRSCYQIDELKLKARIQCRYDQVPENLIQYWHVVTKIPKSQFYRSYVDERSIDKPTMKKNYKGVCTVYYSSAKIQLELEIIANLIINHVIISKHGPVA